MARHKNDGRGRMGGRKKGTPNKTTADLRTSINNLIADNWAQVQKDLNALEPKDRLMFIEKILRYVVPQESNINTQAHPRCEMGEIRIGFDDDDD